MHKVILKIVQQLLAMCLFCLGCRVTKEERREEREMGILYNSLKIINSCHRHRNTLKVWGQASDSLSPWNHACIALSPREGYGHACSYTHTLQLLYTRLMPTAIQIYSYTAVYCSLLAMLFITIFTAVQWLSDRCHTFQHMAIFVNSLPSILHIC